MVEIITSVGTLLTGVGALAAWRNAKAAKAQTNGMLHEPLEQIRVAVLDTQLRVTRTEGVLMDHLRDHNN